MNTNRSAEDRSFMQFGNLVAELVGPALIMLMVGSLSFFLLEVFYGKEHVQTLKWKFGLFAFAAVLISRISIQYGFQRASAYGGLLAFAILFVTSSYVSIVGASIIILVTWWSASRLTWDCTFINDTRDASAEGIVELMRQKTKGWRYKLLGEEPPVDEYESQAFESGSDESAEKETPKNRVMQFLIGRRSPNRPGLWAFYFVIAGFPIFGLGQGMIAASNPLGRKYSALYFCIYMIAGLGLLMMASLLGISRYLRKRDASMNMRVARSWLVVGSVLAIGILAFTFWMPRPTNNLSIAGWMPKIKSKVKEAVDSRFGLKGSDPSENEPVNFGANPRNPDGSSGTGSKKGDGKDGGKTSGDRNKSNSKSGGKSDDSGGKQQGGNHSSGQNDGKGKSGQSGGKKSGKSSGNNKSKSQHKSNQGSQQDNNKNKTKNKSNQANQNDKSKSSQSNKGEKSKNSQSNSKRSDQKNQLKSGEEILKKRSDQRTGRNRKKKNDADKNDADKNQLNKNQNQNSSRKKDSDSKDASQNKSKNQRSSRDSQSRTRDNQSRKNNSSTNQNSPPVFSLLGSLLKFIFWLVLLLAGIYLVIRYRKEIREAWIKFLEDWKKFWNNLFNRNSTETELQSGEFVRGVKPVAQSFSEFGDPFMTGHVNEWSAERVVEYTFRAMEAWGFENGCPREQEQTPHEFAKEVGRNCKPLKKPAVELAELYNQIAYAPGSLEKSDIVKLKELWELMRTNRIVQKTNYLAPVTS